MMIDNNNNDMKIDPTTNNKKEAVYYKTMYIIYEIEGGQTITSFDTKEDALGFCQRNPLYNYREIKVNVL